MCLGTEAISRKHIHFRPLILAILFLIESDMLPIYERVQHFNFQLMHTTLKIVELLKHFKISKTAPTCFGLQGNHHQGATVST